MKKYKILILFGLGLFLSLQMSAQSNSAKTKPAPSDATVGYTYDFDLAKQLIMDYQLNPSEDNKEAKAIVKQKSFPKMGTNNQSQAEYSEKLNLWMEKNSGVIIEALKNRKDIVHKF